MLESCCRVFLPCAVSLNLALISDEEEEEEGNRRSGTVETVTEEEQEHIRTTAAASDVFAVNDNDVSATEFLKWNLGKKLSMYWALILHEKPAANSSLS